MAIVSKFLGLTKRRKPYMTMQENDSMTVKTENYNSPIYIRDSRLCNSTKNFNRLQSISEDEIRAVVVVSAADTRSKNFQTHSYMAIPCRKGYYVQYKKNERIVAGQYKVEERHAPALIVSADKNGIVAYRLDDMMLLYQYPWTSIDKICHEDNALRRTQSKGKTPKPFLGVHRKDGGVFVIESDHISEFKAAIFSHHTDPKTLKWIDVKMDLKSNAHKHMYI